MLTQHLLGFLGLSPSYNFPESLCVHAGIVPLNGHYHFHTYPSQFIVHHLVLCNPPEAVCLIMCRYTA